MKLVNQKVLALCAVSAVAGAALAAPTVASAKTLKFKCAVQSKNPADLTKTDGTVSCGKPLGKFKSTGTLKIPVATSTWHVKGGKLKVVGKGTLNGTAAKGTFKVTGGSGKYKGAKGKGTFTGNLATGKYTYKGSFKY